MPGFTGWAPTVGAEYGAGLWPPSPVGGKRGNPPACPKPEAPGPALASDPGGAANDTPGAPPRAPVPPAILPVDAFEGAGADCGAVKPKEDAGAAGLSTLPPGTAVPPVAADTGGGGTPLGAPKAGEGLMKPAEEIGATRETEPGFCGNMSRCW